MEKFRNIVLLCSNDIKRTNAHIKITLAREAKGSKNNFF